MKTLKILLVTALMLGAFGNAEAQRVVKVYPRSGTVVTTVHKPRIYNYHGITYRFAAGVWYKPFGRRYIVCAAPVGIRINRLPRGHKVVYVHGKRFYKFNGVYYKKRGRGYRVVEV